jgi:hypothetical protein
MLLMKTTLLILRTFKLQVKNSRKNIKLALKHLSDYEELIFVSNIIVIVFVLVFTTFMPQIWNLKFEIWNLKFEFEIWKIITLW